MGSYDNIVKTEEIRKKVEEGDYASAQKILDTMELKKLKNVSDLNLLAEVYKENERYEEAERLYLKIYDKLKTRKTISQLVDIYIKKNAAKEAQEYLEQYQKLSAEDFDGYIFRYKIEKLKGASYEQLIDILIQLKKIEYTEQWAYELAKLYYKAGKEEECIKECTDIILWFGEGTYVEKARMLRSYYTGETDREQMLEKLKQKSAQEDDSNSFVPSEEEADTDEVHYKLDYVEADEGEFEAGLSRNIQDLMSERIPDEEDEPAEASVWEDDEEEVVNLDETEDREESMDDSGEYIQEDTATTQDDDREELITLAQEASEEELISSAQDDSEEETGASARDDYEEEATIESEQEPGMNGQAKEGSLDEDDIKLKQLADKYKLRPDEVFDNFLHVSAVKKQIAKGLEIILKENKRAVFVMITGVEGSGRTTLAKDMALFLYKAGRIKSSKVAKISADKLNTVDIDSKRETLRSCCLVVENASELKRTTIEKILELSKHLQGDIAVVFEEDKKNMNKLFRECPKLMELLRVRIHLPQYTSEDLFGFAVACLIQKDYRLSAKAEGILRSKLDRIAKHSEQHTYLAEINGLMQAAMDCADIRTGKKLTDLASQGRLEEFETVEILPGDFND